MKHFVVTPDTRRKQLSRLIETLEDLLKTLRCDEGCAWLSHFEKCEVEARRLLRDGFSQDQLIQFSRTVCDVYDVYGAAGSFYKYRPPVGASGAENFETYARVAYDRALELRVTGWR